MKKLQKVLLAVALTSAIAATTGLGQTNNHVWQLDENGPAILTGGLVGYSNGRYQLDPLSGFQGWYYGLGGSNVNVAGDVLLLELPGTNQLSDLLRFDGNGVFFFSEATPGDPYPDAADVLHIPIPINPVVLSEVGIEGNNGAFYRPLPGQPGFDLSGELPGLAYNIVSDVPEPGSLVLLLSGAALLGLNVVRRRIRS